MTTQLIRSRIGTRDESLNGLPHDGKTDLGYDVDVKLTSREEALHRFGGLRLGGAAQDAIEAACLRPALRGRVLPTWFLDELPEFAEHPPSRRLAYKSPYDSGGPACPYSVRVR